MASKSKPESVDAPKVSPQRVAAFRLSRHHLAKKAPATALPAVAGDMAGAQAQVLSAAQMSLWARTRGLRLQDVEAAMWKDRTLVKAWCMRGALHLIPSADFAIFVRGCARRGARSTGWLVRAGWDVESIDRMIEAMGRVLDRPLTRKEVARRISESLGAKLKAGAGRGWGGPSDASGFEIGGKLLSLDGLVWLACIRGVACFGPGQGNEATFVRPDRWLPDWHDMSGEEAEFELLRRYLRAHGPATVRDFALWTYVTAADAREIWSGLADELAPVNVDGRLAWVLRADVSSLQRTKIERPCVRLLPFFDSFLLGLKDKGHLVDAAHYKRVYRPAGWLSPVVLVNGRVAGVWSMDRKGGGAVIRIEPFRRISREERDGIEAESADLGRFLGTPSELIVRR